MPKFTDAELAQFTSELDQFIGSQEFYRHALSRKYVYTEGVRFVAERAGAYWLIDKIALHGQPNLNEEDFQVWKLKVVNNSAVLKVEDGNSNLLYTEKIEYTDFPLPEFSLWVERSMEGYTILLPSEH